MDVLTEFCRLLEQGHIVCFASLPGQPQHLDCVLTHLVNVTPQLFGALDDCCRCHNPSPFATFPLPCVSLSHALEAHTTNRVRGECHGGIVPTMLRKGTARDRHLASYLTFPTRLAANMILSPRRTDR